MSHEKTIVQILRSKNALSLESALSPTDLLKYCADAGMQSAGEVEATIIRLIDQDIVEYEMNDKTDVTHIWLLED